MTKHDDRATKRDVEERVTANSTGQEQAFLRLVHHPISRPRLLDRLRDLGLLSAFLAAENETN